MNMNNGFLRLMTIAIVLGVVGISLFSGCDYFGYRKMTKEEIAEMDRKSKECEHKKQINDIKAHIEIIEYNGHSYLVYHKVNHTEYRFDVDVVSITHNPDCRCMKTR